MAKSYSKGTTVRIASSTTGRIGRKRALPAIVKPVLEIPPEPKTYKDYGTESKFDIQDKLKSHYDEATNNLTNPEFIALQEYAGTAFKPINKGLRNDSVDLESKKQIAEIDKTINNAQGLAENTMLYRGVKRFPELYNLQEGDSFTDKGYFSTSFQKNTPLEFLKHGDDKVLIKIKADKGTKGVFLDHPRFVHDSPFESELLLGRNTTFKIMKISNEYHPMSGLVKVFDVELV